MSSFEDRKEGFENKFAYDQEVEFKIKTRRNKLIAQWAGKQLGYDEDKVNAYVDELIVPGVSKEQLVERVKKDFDEAGVAIEDTDIERQLLVLKDQARKELGYE